MNMAHIEEAVSVDEDVHSSVTLQVNENEIRRRKTKIFVGGLKYTSKDDVLHEYFSTFGEIYEAVVIYDRQTGESKGYGFVTMVREENAAAAIENKTPRLDGRKCNVNLAYLGQKKKVERQGTVMRAAPINEQKTNAYADNCIVPMVNSNLTFNYIAPMSQNTPMSNTRHYYQPRNVFQLTDLIVKHSNRMMLIPYHLPLPLWFCPPVQQPFILGNTQDQMHYNPRPTTYLDGYQANHALPLLPIPTIYPSFPCKQHAGYHSNQFKVRASNLNNVNGPIDYNINTHGQSIVPITPPPLQIISNDSPDRSELTKEEIDSAYVHLVNSNKETI